MNTIIAIYNFATLEEVIDYINFYSNDKYYYKLNYLGLEIKPYQVVTYRRYEEPILETNINEFEAFTIPELFQKMGMTMSEGLKLAGVRYGLYKSALHETSDEEDCLIYLISKRYGIDEKKVKEMLYRERELINGKREKN